MRVPFAVMISVTFLCSEMTSGQDLSTVTTLVSYGFEVIQDCAKENNVGLIKLATSLAFSRAGADKNCKCAVACMMENFYLMSDDKVETALLGQVIDVIPIEAMKAPLSELITMCEKKGPTHALYTASNGPNRCDNANAFMMCLKQNALTVATKAIMLG